MNRALLRISLACLAMFVLLLLNVNYVQAFEANSLAGKPGNIRVFNQQFAYQRGAIIANGDGTDVKIAESRLVKGTSTYQRYYPFSKVYAPVTGYDTIYSQSGIEEAENSLLAGTDPRLAVHNFTALLTGKQKQGATVELTISPAAQQAAYNALANDGGHAAAVVAIQPSTGAILALASYPTFNPNALTTFDGTQLNKVDEQLLKAHSQPLLNRAIQETYPPGSSFKIVTSSAWFSAHPTANPNMLVSAPTVLTLPNGNHLINDGGEVCGDGHPPMIQAFWMSCNTAFGALGIKLGAPGAAQPVQPVRDEQAAVHPAAGRAERAAGSQRLDRPVPDRVHGDRPVQRRGVAAAGSAVLGGRRQRRHAHVPVHGPAGSRAGPVSDRPGQDVGAEPGDFANHCGLYAVHDE